MRLDILVSQKYNFTRNKSQAFIQDGLISVNEKIILKPSFEVTGEENILLKADKKTLWVSRSAGKLDGFLDSLLCHCEQSEAIQRKEEDSFLLSGLRCHIPIQGVNCLDVGSSTGGFTQVLLSRGASHVDAVDVGTDQLHESLRNDPRVMSYEQMDIRNFTTTHIYDIIVCDASFISLTDIFPSILRFANETTDILLLWKPQFEVGREHLRKTGVPKDERIVAQKQKEWENFLVINNCKILQKEKSSVIGEAGNQEWLYWIKFALMNKIR